MYIEADGRYSKIFTFDSTRHHICKRLNELEHISSTLLRCHKSYIVNKEFITDFDACKMIIELNSEYEIPIGAIYKKLVLSKI